MTKNLVIVESPAKSKTLQKYLGEEFSILASYGHIRDLLPKSGSVDTENGFAMRYQVIEKNAKRLDDISKALKKHIHYILHSIRIARERRSHGIFMICCKRKAH